MSFGAGAQQHYSTLLRLKQYFPFSLIDAMGSLDECKAQIARELRYQSSLDLDESTCAAFCVAIICVHPRKGQDRQPLAYSAMLTTLWFQ